MPFRTGLSACLLPVSALAGDLIGRTVPPYPDGLRDIGGSCLSDIAGYEHICDYSIGVLADDDDEDAPPIRYVVAGRMAGRDGQMARWTITDAVAYPKAGDGYHLQTGNCRVHGKDDGRVVAVVRDDQDGEFLRDVIWARRLELPAGRFTVLDPVAVDCINEAYLGL